jgi:hypothetical protein
MSVGRNACEVTAPDGRVWREADRGDLQPTLTRGLAVHYPMEFPGAPPLISGTYKVRWLLGTRPGKWREILSYDEMVELGEMDA